MAVNRSFKSYSYSDSSGKKKSFKNASKNGSFKSAGGESYIRTALSSDFSDVAKKITEQSWISKEDRAKYESQLKRYREAVSLAKDLYVDENDTERQKSFQDALDYSSSIIDGLKIYNDYETEEDYTKAVNQAKLNEKMDNENLGQLRSELDAWYKIMKRVETAEGQMQLNYHGKKPNRKDVSEEDWKLYLEDKSWLDQYGSFEIVEGIFEKKKNYYNQVKEYKNNPIVKAQKIDLTNEEIFKKAREGFKAFEAGAPQREDAKRKKQREDWELNYKLGMMGGIDSSAIGFYQARSVYANDTSYKEPQENWSQDEKDRFGYLYAEDEEEAYDYATAVNNNYAAAERQKSIEAIEKWAGQNFGTGLASFFGQIASMPLAIVDVADRLAEYSARGEITQRDFVSFSEFESALGSGVANSLNEWSGTIDEDAAVVGGKGAGDLYNILTSITKNIVYGKMLGGAGTMVSYFGSATSSGINDALSRGATSEQALAFGFANGIAEALCEKFSVEKLLKIESSATVRQALKNLLMQGVAEGSEEGMTSLFNNISDQLIMMDKSQYNMLKKEYMLLGMSEEEAEKKAWKELANELAYDVLSGFVSGVGSGGIMQTMQNVSANIFNKKTDAEAQALIDKGMRFDENSNAYKLALKMQQKAEAGKRMSGSKALTLEREIKSENIKADRGKILSAVSSRLKELGEVENVSGVAEAITKNIVGESLSISDKLALNKSTFAERVANEADPSNIKSGKYNSSWIENLGTEEVNYSAYNTEKVARDERDLEELIRKVSGESIDEASVKEIAENARISESGKATTIDGKEVEIKRVVSNNNGKTMLKLSDGRVVSADKLLYENVDQYTLYKSIGTMEFDPTTANEIIDLYKTYGAQDINEFVLGMRQGYNYGWTGIESGNRNGEHFKGLSEDNQRRAVEMGKRARKRDTEERRKKSPQKSSTNKNENKSNTNKSGRVIQNEHISMEDFMNSDASVWNNVEYGDIDKKAKITKKIHDDMVEEGAIVSISKDIFDSVSKSFPNLRALKKQERVKLIKESMKKLKNDLRYFLNDFKDDIFEFNVNDKVLDAKLYSTGINEVLEKITQEKASMLYATDEIFKNARYIYSTSDYNGDPNIYRWNYFYTPVQIGEEIVGVRIAIRDIDRGVGMKPESQIYNWGIKKDTSLDGGRRGPKVASSGVSSDVSNDIISETKPSVNPENGNLVYETSEEVNLKKLNDLQKTGLKIAEVLSGITKSPVHIYDSVKDEDGRRVFAKDVAGYKAGQKAPNGFYKAGVIYIDINAGNNGEGMVLYTLAHEYVHRIRELSPDKFNKLASFLVEEYGKAGESVEDLIEEQRNKAKDNGRSISYDTAFEEFVADAMQTMLVDSDIVSKLERLKDADKGLWERFKDMIRGLYESIKKAYNGTRPSSKEANALRKLEDGVIGKLADLFAEGLADISRIESSSETAQQKNTTEDGGTKSTNINFSLRIDEYPYSMRTVIKEYLNSANLKFIDFINDARSEKNKKRLEYMHFDFENDINDKILSGAKDILGFDISNYKIQINGESVHHIDYRHGKNGKQDQSMKNDLDISRVQYVLNNADFVQQAINSKGEKAVDSQYRDKNNKSSKVLLFAKKVNGTYCVALASPESNKQTLHIKSMYFAKKIEEIQEFDAKSPEPTSKTNLEISSKNSIRNPDENVNKNSENIFESETLLDDRDVQSLDSRTLLAKTLEASAKDDKELRNLKRYQEVASELNEDELELARVRREIHEIMFGRGGRDKVKLAELNSRKISLQEKISKMDKKLLKLEVSEPLRRLVERESDKAAKDMREDMKERAKRDRDRHSRTIARSKVKGIVGSLYQLLLTNSKERHVPQEMQKAVREMLTAFNFDTVNASGRIERLNKNILDKVDAQIVKMAERDVTELSSYELDDLYNRAIEEAEGERREELEANADEIISFVEKKEKILNSEANSLKEKLNGIKTEIESNSKNSVERIIAESVGEALSKRFLTVIENVGNVPLYEMSEPQLMEVYDLFAMLKKSIQTANKIFKEGKVESANAAATKLIQEVEEQGKKVRDKTVLGKGASWTFWSNLKPLQFARTIGSKTLEGLFGDLHKGESKWAGVIEAAKKRKDEIGEKYKFSKFKLDREYQFTDRDGNKFELSLNQLMSLYAYVRRGEKAIGHIINGGFKLGKLKSRKVKKDDEGNIKESGNRQKKTVREYYIENPKVVSVTREGLADIISQFDEIEKKSGMQIRKYIEEMQEFLSSDLAQLGNDVSMQLFGIELFKEQAYFPLKSDEDFIAALNEPAKTAKLLNAGFTKQTVPNARNPIVLENFTNVWAGHVNDMALYYAMALPIENINRVMNMHTAYSEDTKSVSVKNTINSAFGENATRYIDDLIQDLNGGVRVDSRESPLKGLTSRWKKAKVFASLSVIIQQPTSIFRAMAYISPKNLFFHIPGKNLVVHRKKWDELKTYSKIAVIKEMGRFDTDSGRTTQEYLFEKKGFRNVADNFLSFPASFLDEATWVVIWEASKREVYSSNKKSGMKFGSREHLEASAEFFDKVVANTQVYDSVLSRSSIMRSKSSLAIMATAFMSEPTTTLNMALEGMQRLKRGDIKGASRHVGSVVTQIVINAAVVALVYAMRDDDEDKGFLEKYLNNFGYKAISEFLVIGNIPFVKDLVSLAEGYSVERTDMAVLGDIINAVTKYIDYCSKDEREMDDEELEKYEEGYVFAVFECLASVADATGIPLSNIRKDVKGIYKTVNAFVKNPDRQLEAKASDLFAEFTESKVAKAITKLTVSTGIDKVVDDLDNGIDAKNYVNELIEEKKLAYIETKEYNEKEAIKEAKSSIKSGITKKYKQRYLRAYRNKDKEEMLRIRKALYSTGLYPDVSADCLGWIKQWQNEQKKKAG